MKTFSGIIDAIGYDLLEEECDITRQHAYQLKARDTIPPLHWDGVLKAAAIVNYSLDKDELKALYKAKLPQKKRQPSEAVV